MFFQVSRTTFNDVMEPQCIAPNKNFQIRQIIGKTVAVYNRKQRKNFADNRQKKKSAKTNSIIAQMPTNTPKFATNLRSCGCAFI